LGRHCQEDDKQKYHKASWTIAAGFSSIEIRIRIEEDTLDPQNLSFFGDFGAYFAFFCIFRLFSTFSSKFVIKNSHHC
jgi:hypothetical protein